MPSPPRVCIVTPALADANNGNWRTASRWRRFLAPVVDVEVVEAWPAEASDADVLIALHARRSAASIARAAALRPALPIALVLTGTDLYRDLAEDDADARHSVECASALVVLQEAALARLDADGRRRARVIVQSAPALRLDRRPADADFVAVGHLRAEKDPATLLAAVRRFAATSSPADGAPASRNAARRATVAHIGAALDAALADDARATMAACPAYRWLGALSHARTRRTIACARALVHPSRMEGGANVVVEAVRSGVPVLASRIDGNVGLLGADYDGFFAVGDADALAALMARFADDATFADRLRRQCAAREPLFAPAQERRAVRTLVADLLGARRSDVRRRP